jgi:glycosyltransferase involved in cell wall biosynthesis
MLNVLLVPVNDLLSHPIETRFTSIAKKMVENFNIKIFVLRYINIPTSSSLNRKLPFESVEFKDLKMKNIGMYYLSNVVPMFSAIFNQLKKKRIDIIIHANVLPSAIAVKLGKMLHKPLIYDFQDYFPESAASYFKGSLFKSLTYSVTTEIVKFNIKYSDAVVTVTNAHKEKIKEYDPLKLVKVIPNGVDTNLFRPIPKSEALKKLNMDNMNGKTILLYYGSIDPWLDFLTMFKAIKNLVKKGHDILLFIVGFCHSKYYLKEIKEAAQRIGIYKRLFIFDPMPQRKLVYYINASDVTVVPYKLSLKNQAVPLKVLESLACGKFVCVTKLPEIMERFGDVIGTYSCSDDLEYILLKYIKGEFQGYGDKITKIISQYSWDNIASKYYNLINEIINQQKQK